MRIFNNTKRRQFVIFLCIANFFIYLSVTITIFEKVKNLVDSVAQKLHSGKK